MSETVRLQYYPPNKKHPPPSLTIKQISIFVVARIQRYATVRRVQRALLPHHLQPLRVMPAELFFLNFASPFVAVILKLYGNNSDNIVKELNLTLHFYESAHNRLELN